MNAPEGPEVFGQRAAKGVEFFIEVVGQLHLNVLIPKQKSATSDSDVARQT